MTQFPDISPHQYITSNLSRLDDFWRRGESSNPHDLSFSGFGHPILFVTNNGELLKAAEISNRRFTQQQLPKDGKVMKFEFHLDKSLPNQEVPDDFPKRLRYMGFGDTLTISGHPWVNAFCDLARWEGAALISRSLAMRPDFLSRFIIDCFVLNMLLRTGWGQLHASCLQYDKTTFLLSAPSNTGKSTTAYRLLDHGWRILTDGMSYLHDVGVGIEIYGYPVGELRLRMDMAAELQERRITAKTALIREDRKFVLNLRESMPGATIERPIIPEKIVIGLLQRHGQPDTKITRISPSQALDGLFPDALHLDRAELLSANLDPVINTIKVASCYQIDLGVDPDQLVRSFESII